MISTTDIHLQNSGKTVTSAKGFLDWCSNTKRDLGKKAQPTRERYDFVLPEIPPGWCWASLSEVCERVSVGHVGPTTEYFSDDKESVPLVRSQDVRPGKLHIESAAHITYEFHQKLKKSKLHSGDILFVRVGANRGDCCVVPSGVGEVNCANIIFARPLVPNGFLGFYFRGRFAQESLLSATTGAAQGVINTECVARMPVPIPPVCIQQRISDILSAYDGLIENNTRRIKILEQMAQMLYREWFVNFRFPGHENVKMVESEMGLIPERWQVSTLGEVTTKIGSGATPRGGKESYQRVGITLIRSLNIYDYRFEMANLAFINDEQAKQLSNVTIEPNDVLLNITGASVCRCSMVPSSLLPARVNQHVAIVRAKSTSIDPFFLLDSINNDHNKQRLLGIAQGGATREALTRDSIAGFPILLPPLELIRRYGQIAGSIHTQRENLSQRITNLRTTRDLLLPKLVSGEVSVESLEEEALAETV